MSTILKLSAAALTLLTHSAFPELPSPNLVKIAGTDRLHGQADRIDRAEVSGDGACRYHNTIPPVLPKPVMIDFLRTAQTAGIPATIKLTIRYAREAPHLVMEQTGEEPPVIYGKPGGQWNWYNAYRAVMHHADEAIDLCGFAADIPETYTGRTFHRWWVSNPGHILELGEPLLPDMDMQGKGQLAEIKPPQ